MFVGHITRSLNALFFVSDARRETVIGQTVAGSRANTIYFVLMGLSVLIAAFGLLANSPAVVIGAMLVSPLMTPIMGISLALVRGDLKLLAAAGASELGGVLVAIFLPSLLALLPLEFEVTSEVLARTNPTLLDLLVAAFAGMAGCLATIDERISPVLPGIAIATSLTPPLAASGLCLALGSYLGAWGAFLLFFSNFLAILFVSSAVFLASGFTARDDTLSKKILLKRYGMALLGLLVVVFLLTDALIKVTHDRWVRNVARRVLQEETRNPGLIVQDLIITEENGGLDILAVVRAPKPPPPRRLSVVQQRLTKELKQEVHCFLSCNLTQYVAAEGATRFATGQDLDGELVYASDPLAMRKHLAEQAIRELLGDRPGLNIVDVELRPREGGDVVLVTGTSLRRPLREQVEALEMAVRQRLGDPTVRLLLRRVAVEEFTDEGQGYLVELMQSQLSAQEQARLEQVSALAKRTLQAIPGLDVAGLLALPGEGGLHVWGETRGTRLPDPQEVSAAQARIAEELGEPVQLMLRSRVEAAVTSQGYEPADLIFGDVDAQMRLLTPQSPEHE